MRDGEADPLDGGLVRLPIGDVQGSDEPLEDTTASADGGATPSPSEEGTPDVATLTAQGVRVGFGLAAVTVAVLAESIRRTLPSPPVTDERAAPSDDPVALVAGAALGLMLTAGEWTAESVARAIRTIVPPASWFLATPARAVSAPLADLLHGLDGRWKAARPDAEAAANVFTRELVPRVVDAILDQMDLTWLVAERVDLDELVARVNLDAVADRIDIDRILATVDLDGVAGRLDLERVVARVDLDRIVERIDVDAIAARLDVEAVVDRLDLAVIAREVIDEIDLPEIIRESSGAMASETVRGIRLQGIGADEAVSRAVDRLMRRRRAPHEAVEGGHDDVEGPG